MLMGIRAYGRHRGVSHSAVQQAISTGRIRRRADGRIDSAQADRDWELRTDPSKPRNAVTGEPKHRRAPGAPPSPMGSHGAGNGNGDGTSDRLLSSYAASRAIRELYLSRMAKLEFELADGKLLDAQWVSDVAFRSARNARDIWRGIPDRLAPVLIGLTDPARIRELIAAEIAAGLAELEALPKRLGRAAAATSR